MEQCVVNQEFARAAELKQLITELEDQKEVLDSEENSFSQTVRSEEKVYNIWKDSLECGYKYSSVVCWNITATYLYLIKGII